MKMKIDRSPQYEESGRFCSTENSGHEGSKSLRVIIIFKPQKIPVISGHCHFQSLSFSF